MVVLRRGTGVESEGTVPGGGPNHRFPGFDVLAEADTWDPVTAGVVLARLGPPPPIRFFTQAEQAVGAQAEDDDFDERLTGCLDQFVDCQWPRLYLTADPLGDPPERR